MFVCFYAVRTLLGELGAKEITPETVTQLDQNWSRGPFAWRCAVTEVKAFFIFIFFKGS